MTVWALTLLAVCCNAAAQVLIKQAGSLTGAHGETAHGSGWMVLGASLVLYGLSFLVTVWVYARLPLSVASPLMAGGVFVLVSLASVFLFAEALTMQRLAGMVLVILGVTLLYRSA